VRLGPGFLLLRRCPAFQSSAPGTFAPENWVIATLRKELGQGRSNKLRALLQALAPPRRRKHSLQVWLFAESVTLFPLAGLKRLAQTPGLPPRFVCRWVVNAAAQGRPIQGAAPARSFKAVLGIAEFRRRKKERRKEEEKRKEENKRATIGPSSGEKEKNKKVFRRGVGSATTVEESESVRRSPFFTGRRCR